MAWNILSTINLIGQRVDAPSWATATFYRFGSLVFMNSKHYSCKVAHTSGVFATDLTDEKWFEVDIFDSIYFEMSVNPIIIDAFRMTKNGVEQARDVNHIYLQVRHDFASGKTTGFVGTRQALVNGDQVVLYHDPSYYNYISTGIPALEGRVQTLETKVGGLGLPSEISAIKSRLTEVEGYATPLQNQITANKVDSDDSKAQIPVIKDRVTALENKMIVVEKFVGVEGRVSINNNQLIPVEIPELQLDGNVHTSARIDYEIRRSTGTEFRMSTGTLHFCLKENGVWETDRNVVSFDVDGISFAINTVLDKVGKVSYTSDNVVGASYVGTFKFRRYVFEV